MILSFEPKYRLIRAALSGCALLIVLSGCGGGGGGSGNGPPPTGVRWLSAAASVTYPEVVPSEHAAAYDLQRNRTVIAWGRNGSDFIGEVWDLTVSENQKVIWQKLLPGGKESPLPRADHSAVYDSGAKRLLYYGGYTGSGVVGEIWEIGFQNSAAGVWRKLSPGGDEPAPRRGHTAVFDDPNNRMLVFGGWDGAGAYYPDLWEVRFDDSEDGTWSKLGPVDGPLSRAEHSAMVDPGRSRMILFGGRNETGELNDTWELNWSGGTPVWKEWTNGGAVPSARSGHTAALDPDGDRMILFGGTGSGKKLNDVWSLDLSGSDQADWRELVPAGEEAPEGREQHIAIRDNSFKGFRMTVFGGFPDPPGLVWLLENQE